MTDLRTACPLTTHEVLARAALLAPDSERITYGDLANRVSPAAAGNGDPR
ncbi:hypothetical protein [Amycolatopsis sp. SID8362]|nr:hypothetical protein [Amycolatopsis sp. SID8362]NBH05008.1 hypothetical protein [Amycolatopsis sp. SID8362]NED41708.1 hypothetical protein [Amycolatopsis sp. SID8362]